MRWHRSLALLPKGRSCHSRAQHNIGFAFDVDGVLLRGGQALPGAKESLHKLRSLQIPFVVLTNNGGMTEEARAAELTERLDTDIIGDHVVLSHSAMANAASQFAKDPVLVLGSREYVEVARKLGLTNIVTPRDVATQDPQISPYFQDLSSQAVPDNNISRSSAVPLEDIKAIFILHDPVEWSFELQICLDLLRGGSPLGSGVGEQQLPLYTSNSDFSFMSTFPVPRFAQGTFHACLAHLFEHTTGQTLRQENFGKPFPVQFQFAKDILCNLSTQEPFDRIYMIGDNPSADIRGANDAGHPWRSVLVRTGVFGGGTNDPNDPAHLVFDDVGQAVTALLTGDHLDV
jgi:HAD superfamily hydrolase (TIGR01456 family)